MEKNTTLSSLAKKEAISLIFNLLFFDQVKQPEFKLIDNKLLALISDNFKNYIYEKELIKTYNYFSKQFFEKLDSKQKKAIHTLYLYVSNSSFDESIYSKSINSLTIEQIISLQTADSILNQRLEDPLVKGFIADLIIVKEGIQIYHDKYISRDFYKNVINEQLKKCDDNAIISKRTLNKF